jgi:hydroxyacylglutathione hydrolase
MSDMVVAARPGSEAATPVQRISLASVNCYLIRAGAGFVLIDSSKPEKRGELDGELTRAGCVPGSLNIVVLTHGDYDHAGNAAYLRDRYKTRIAMHQDDSERVERGDWSLNMKPKPDKVGLLFRTVSLFIKPGPFDTFTPDVYVADGDALSAYGLDATVLHLPGHTRGSIGVRTGEGDVFCGDLFDSMMGKPSFEFFIDDMAAARTSLQRLRTLDVGLVYPGHGKPFRLDRIRGSR